MLGHTATVHYSTGCQIPLPHLSLMMNRSRSKLNALSIVAVLVLAFNPELALHSWQPAVETVTVERIVEPASEYSAQQEQWLQEQLGDGLDVRDRIASDVVSEQFVQQISAVEWLAPLAPVALSPFFGITLLSGLACYGPDWLPNNALLSEGSPLANPTMFWVFLVLTVITSAPRFSKVSKPIAQLADFLETYSAIVILLVLKVVAMNPAGATSDPDVLVPAQAGILSAGWEGLLMLAMAINIVVVNTVKFFFEFLVWITPIPFLDACFEIANKVICACLMAVYAFSPLLALAINVALFVACAFAFVWIKRREVFYRTMLFDWLVKSWKNLSGNRSAEVPAELVVFPVNEVGGVPARAKCKLTRSDGVWNLQYHPLLKSAVTLEVSGPAELKPGWWTNTVDFGHGLQLTFSSKHNDQMPQLAESMEFSVAQSDDVTEATRRKVEFA